MLTLRQFTNGNLIPLFEFDSIVQLYQHINPEFSIETHLPIRIDPDDQIYDDYIQKYGSSWNETIRKDLTSAWQNSLHSVKINSNKTTKTAIQKMEAEWISVQDKFKYPTPRAAIAASTSQLRNYVLTIKSSIIQEQIQDLKKSLNSITASTEDTHGIRKIDTIDMISDSEWQNHRNNVLETLSRKGLAYTRNGHIVFNYGRWLWATGQSEDSYDLIQNPEMKPYQHDHCCTRKSPSFEIAAITIWLQKQYPNMPIMVPTLASGKQIDLGMIILQAYYCLDPIPMIPEFVSISPISPSKSGESKNLGKRIDALIIVDSTTRDAVIEFLTRGIREIRSSIQQSKSVWKNSAITRMKINKNLEIEKIIDTLCEKISNQIVENPRVDPPDVLRSILEGIETVQSCGKLTPSMAKSLDTLFTENLTSIGIRV